MHLSRKEQGQGLVEYVLILILVFSVVLVVLTIIGPAVGNMFSNVVRNIQNLPPTPVP